MSRFATLGRWLVVAISSLVVVSALSFQTAGAINLFGDACDQPGADQSSVCSADDQDNISGSDGDGIVLQAASLIAVVAGVTAVIMIAIGGFMMITAGGDSQKVGTARKTIIYAVVGLVVIILARSIIGFVVTHI
jgi:hypothetical protein